MPGFVDVSNMSAQEVKRMGQQDDDIDYQPRRGRSAALPQVGYAVSDVWAAACAAQRVNGEYLKESRPVLDPNEPGRVLSTRVRNRDLMMEFLQNPDRITVDDVEAGEQCRNFLQQDLTFRALKGQLTAFDTSVSKCLAVQDRFYTVQHRYELAVMARLPASATRSQTRQDTDHRMKFARGGFIGKLGDKISTQVEVLSCNYSQQYAIFWVRGITDQDQPVMFSAKEKFDVGTHLTIQGKVKAHRDNLTQLNYVKVL